MSVPVGVRPPAPALTLVDGYPRIEDPQAFSHIGLINSAVNLKLAQEPAAR